MSAEMRDFAAAFNVGLGRGMEMYNKDQERAIQREHNKLLRDQHEATERHQTRRDDLYAESVKNAGALSAARAQALLNKGAGKGGGAAAAPSNSNVDMVHQGALAVGLVPPPAPPQPTAPSVTNNYVQQETSDPGPISPPGMRKGGMVKKYADGGMTVQEALSYGPKTGKAATTPATPASAAGSAFSSAYEKSAAAYEKEQKDKADAAKSAANNVRPTGPVGTGAGGGYTTQDVRPGGVLDTTSTGISGTDYRRGGAVRKFAGGGAADLSDPEAAVKSMAYTPADKNPDGSNKTKDEDDGPIASSSRAAASPTVPDYSAFYGGSTGGTEGTSGVGGAADDGSGGSAAAGVGGDDGGTYRRGGRVRRFQSGGRVMEAIDTGTSGPGSGYGYRAAPPARRY